MCEILYQGHFAAGLSVKKINEVNTSEYQTTSYNKTLQDTHLVWVKTTRNAMFIYTTATSILA